MQLDQIGVRDTRISPDISPQILLKNFATASAFPSEQTRPYTVTYDTPIKPTSSFLPSHSSYHLIMPVLAFVGLRKKFLDAELDGYCAAMANGTQDDHAKDITRRFFKRFPPELPHDQEPSAEHLASVDDSLPDVEPQPPNAEADYPEDQTTFYRLEKLYLERSKIIEKRTDQIERWLKYHAKDTIAAESNDGTDYISIMKRRLLGKEFLKKPRKSAAFSVWAKAKKDVIGAAYAATVKEKGQFNLKLRTILADELWKKEPSSVHKHYEKLAIKNHEEEVKAWQSILKMTGSSDPKVRQECIDGITSFLQPIFDLVVEFTGMRLTCMMGGPEPADFGRLNIISLHAGHTKGPVKMTFGEAEYAAYERHIVPVFSDFLRKCYSREDCEASSLGSDAFSLLATSESKDVIHGAASGENYGPSDPGNSAKPSGKKRSRKEGRQSGSDSSAKGAAEGVAMEVDEVGEDTASADSYQQSDTEDLPSRNSSKARRTSAQSNGHTPAPVVPRIQRSKSSARIRQGKKDKNSPSPPAYEGDIDEGGQNGDRSHKSGLHQDLPLLPATRSLSSPILGTSPPRLSSPASDLVPVSPTNSRSPSPTSAVPALDEPRDWAQIDDPSGTATGAHLSSTPSTRFGPPRRCPHDGKKWRVRRAADATSAQTQQLPLVSSGTSDHVERLPCAPARVLVPLSSAGAPPPRPTPASSTSTTVSYVPSGHAAARALGLDTASLRPNAAPSSGKRSRPEGDEVTGAVEHGKVAKKAKGFPEKENLQLEVASGAGSQGVSETGGKRRSGSALEGAVPKRHKAANSATKVARPTLPRMSTGSFAPKLPRPPAVASSPSSSSNPITSSSSSFSQWVLPPDAPDAIKQTLQLVRFGCWGKDWEALVTAWLAFEAARGYPTDQRLGCKHRPPAVSEWIQRARVPTYRPKYKTNEYQMMFWKWWIDLQPEWRDIYADTAHREVNGSWDVIDKAGTNGLASVMAALSFWGVAVEEEGVGSTSWKLAVNDVCWVIQQLCQSEE